MNDLSTVLHDSLDLCIIGISKHTVLIGVVYLRYHSEWWFEDVDFLVLSELIIAVKYICHN